MIRGKFSQEPQINYQENKNSYLIRIKLDLMIHYFKGSKYRYISH